MLPHHRHWTRERSTAQSLLTQLRIFIAADEEYGSVWGPNSINICSSFPTGSEQAFGERQQEKSPFSACFYRSTIYLSVVKTSKPLCGIWHQAWKGNIASMLASQWAQIRYYLCQTCILVKLCWSQCTYSQWSLQQWAISFTLGEVSSVTVTTTPETESTFLFWKRKQAR